MIVAPKSSIRPVLGLSRPGPELPASQTPPSTLGVTETPPQRPWSHARETLTARDLPNGRDPQAAVAWMEEVTGLSSPYTSDEALQTYVGSMQGIDIQELDRHGFLASLGLQEEDARSIGRGHRQLMMATRAAEEFKRPFFTRGLYATLRRAPWVFTALTAPVNAAVVLKARVNRPWRKPWVGPQHAPVAGASNSPLEAPRPSPRQNYPEAYSKMLVDSPAFRVDFHMGDPNGESRYGTIAIAEALGFSREQAVRMGTANRGIDWGETSLGRTGPHPLGAVDRHFNLERKDGPDSRLVWAERHLVDAIELGRRGDYESAERELGHGLHSLQDAFAHGQLKPTHHAAFFHFPDNVRNNPIGFLQATRVTVSYLRAYLTSLTPPSERSLTQLLGNAPKAPSPVPPAPLSQRP